MAREKTKDCKRGFDASLSFLTPAILISPTFAGVVAHRSTIIAGEALIAKYLLDNKHELEENSATQGAPVASLVM